ncbi:unnamed protein product [Psylliodes chrysocephalus]|uniref:MADF domain-containing protein n=1 Tax=Psylliodes chrysocephalus TaxID=3402493 RepID=A0A9P0CYB3_9CUCU|nr:unnamed protein product [Psylliodes chrysocephala]
MCTCWLQCCSLLHNRAKSGSLYISCEFLTLLSFIVSICCALFKFLVIPVKLILDFKKVLWSILITNKKMEFNELDGNTQIYCDICNETVTINALCQHFQVQEKPEDLEECSDAPKEYGSFEENLISTIQAHPILWDPTIDIKLKSKSAKDKAWLEIFNLFNEKYSIEIIKKKWKNLKDTYIKTKNYMESYVPSGSGAIKKKRSPGSFSIQ